MKDICGDLAQAVCTIPSRKSKILPSGRLLELT